MTARTQTQKTINWPRQSQLSTLDRAQFPTMISRDKRRVQPLLLKAVLRTIDSYGRGSWGFPSQEKIAHDSNCSLRQAKRAIEALQELGVVIVERRWYGVPGSRKTGNHYLVVWSELALYCPDNRRRDPADQSAQTADQSAQTADQSAHVGTFLEAHKRAIEPPPPTPSIQPATSTRSSAAAVSVAVSWQEVATRLHELRLDLATDTVRVARQLEFSPAEIWEACDWYEANVDRLKRPGAIRWWIQHDRVWPAEGLRDPRVIEEARKAKAARLAEAEAEAKKQAANDQAWRAEYHALEAAYGGDLRALDDGEQLELAKACFSTGFEMERWRRGDLDARYRLLVFIHENRAAGMREAGSASHG